MPPTNDPSYQAMLQSLKYPNPPAGVAVILVNVGEDEPVAIHIDLDDGVKRTFSFAQGEITMGQVVDPQTLVSSLHTMLPERPLAFGIAATGPDLTPEGKVRASKQVMQYLDPNNMKKIQAIKEARSLTGLGLKEAKDLVDKICQDQGWTSPRY